jgi:hypothetical protein
LCDPGLCPDAQHEGGRCDSCPLNKLDAAQHGEKGLLVRRALELRAAIKLGAHVTLDNIPADEFYAMLTLEEEQEDRERERFPRDR